VTVRGEKEKGLDGRLLRRRRRRAEALQTGKPHRLSKTKRLWLTSRASQRCIRTVFETVEKKREMVLGGIPRRKKKGGVPYAHLRTARVFLK